MNSLERLNGVLIKDTSLKKFLREIISDLYRNGVIINIKDSRFIITINNIDCIRPYVH